MAAQGLFDLIGDMDNGIVKRFLRRIRTNALTAKKLDPQQK